MKIQIFFLFLLTSCLSPVAVKEEASPDGNLNPNSEGESTDGIINTITPGADPLLVYQWHLENTGKFLGVSGVDINSRSLYDSGNKGAGVTVVVVDDGLEVDHEDLFSNIALELGYNYLNNSSTSTPIADLGHGTACAGIIGARDLNSVGGRGIAPRATLVGYNLLANYSNANARDAMTRNKNDIDISNNSWGPVDGYGTFVKADTQWQLGIQEGVNTGRGGKGTIYVFAAGNGGAAGDISNFDGFASHPGVMAVAAVGNRGKYAFYSELGSNIWISAPSMGDNGVGITTTDLVGSDRGYNKGATSDLIDDNYTKTFNGTSAATPMVSGVAALMLKENPELGFRDVKNIIAKSAKKIDSNSTLWTVNGAGIETNYSYGFGLIDAEAAVQMASTWSNLPELLVEQWPVAGAQNVGASILDDGTKVQDDIEISGSGISNIEFVQVRLNIDHADWGNLSAYIVRQGAITTRSLLMIQHSCKNLSDVEINCTVSDESFTFGTARHLDEPADGTWRIEIRDEETDSIVGSLDSWRLKIYGH